MILCAQKDGGHTDRFHGFICVGPCNGLPRNQPGQGFFVQRCAGARPLQRCIRQQVQGLRLRPAESRGCGGGRAREVTWRDLPEEARQAGTVRAHAKTPARSISARLGARAPGADDYLFRRPRPSADPARSGPGSFGRAKPGHLWHPRAAAHQGLPHVSQDRQPGGCAGCCPDTQSLRARVM